VLVVLDAPFSRIPGAVGEPNRVDRSRNPTPVAQFLVGLGAVPLGIEQQIVAAAIANGAPYARGLAFDRHAVPPRRNLAAAAR